MTNELPQVERYVVRKGTHGWMVGTEKLEGRQRLRVAQ
jgi:hypothetical protein